MKISLRWLSEYVPIKISPAELAERLAMHGLEVEDILDRRHDYDHVVVGEIVGIRPHPNADKLRLADVVVKSGTEPQEIVCGAPNIEIGQKVPVALLGAKLPNGLVIESRPIRGVVSNGMLCAEDELGLGTSHAGILVLDPALPVGTALVTALELDDVVLDISIPSNRPDLYSVVGLAREIAAILGVKMRGPKGISTRVTSTSKPPIAVRVTSPKLSPLYTARLVRGVSIKPSPLILQKCLQLAGIRPINAVVDATNFIMLKFGQPLHAFDAAKVQGPITVRTAAKGERLRTLDGQDRVLDPSMVVIADARGPIALAGVMGGADSEISETTTDIIVESAIFDPVAIRRTSRQLGLVSEASKRFEKGLPLTLPDIAGEAAVAMILDLVGGTRVPGVARVGQVASRPIVVTIAPSRFSELLGMTIKPADAKRILNSLGFTLRGTMTKWQVAVPTWRLDVATPQDLVDEIGRLVGYEQLPMTMPTITTIPQPLPAQVQFKDRLRDILTGLGFTEVITHAYYGQPWANENAGRHFSVANPLDKTQQYLRKSLVQQLHSILTAAVDAGQDANIFQIGRVFDPTLPGDIAAQQPWKLCLGIAFRAGPNYLAGSKMAAVVSGVLAETLGVDSIPSVVTSATLKGRTIELLELDVKELLEHVPAVKKYNPVPQFPLVMRDISVLLPQSNDLDTLHDSALKEIWRTGKYLRRVSSRASMYEGRVNILIQLGFAADDRTLTKNEVDESESLIKNGLKKLGCTLR